MNMLIDNADLSLSDMEGMRVMNTQIYGMLAKFLLSFEGDIDSEIVRLIVDGHNSVTPLYTHKYVENQNQNQSGWGCYYRRGTWERVDIPRVTTLEEVADSSASSGMSTAWKNLPVGQMFTPQIRAILKDISDGTGVSFPKGAGIFAMINIITKLSELLSLDMSDGTERVERKRNPRKSYSGSIKDTIEFIFPNTTRTEREDKYPDCKWLWSNKNYRKAVGILGKFLGRYKNMGNSALARASAKLDKYGSYGMHGDKGDLATRVFCIMLMSELGVRKAFTLDSQMQGGLPAHLRDFLDKYLLGRPETDFSRIFSLVPTPRIAERLTVEELTEHKVYWMNKLRAISFSLEKQLGNGVYGCISNGWLVPRRGTTSIDVNAWNACAGAFSNACRHLRSIENAVGCPPTIIFSVCKLTAGDQAQWASSAGKEEDPKIRVIGGLIQEGIMPWSCLDTENPQVLANIMKKCYQEKVPIERLVGLPKERTAVMVAHVDMICGVATGYLPKEVMDWLKGCGFAGSKPGK